MATMKLYDIERSGNCYRVRLLLALLGKEYDKIPVDTTKGEQKRPEYLRINPRGQVPALQDGDVVVWDSMAILVYLARKYGGEQWLPGDAAQMAEVMQWLAVCENEHLYGLARARAIKLFNRPGDWQEFAKVGNGILNVMNTHLAQRQWLACARATIADIACYPYVALAPQGDIPLDAYPDVLAWMARIKALPGYVGMPGVA
jgi:glutathione S-transferase